MIALTPCYIFVYSVLHLGLVAIENDMPRTRLIGPQVAPAQVVHDKQHGIGAPRVPGSVGAYVARLGVVARRYPKLRPLRFESHPRTFFYYPNITILDAHTAEPVNSASKSTSP